MLPLSQLLTLFTTCKPFIEDIGVMQHNAAATWLDLECPVVVIGAESGVEEYAVALGALNLRDNSYHSSGMPYVNDVFAKAQNAIKTPFCAYINADILLPEGTASVLEKCLNSADAGRPFLLTARRRNIPLNQPLPADKQARTIELNQLDRTYGTWDSSSAVDFFAFPTGMLDDLPPFLFGRMQWDNWLLWKAKEMGAQIIDASYDMHLLHPIHGYATDGTNWLVRAHGEEAVSNRQLAGGKSLSLSDAFSHILQGNEISEATAGDKQQLEAFCQPDPDKELQAGMENLSGCSQLMSPEQIVDFCRTLLWRAGYFFPSLLDADPTTSQVEATLSVMRSEKADLEKTHAIQRLVANSFLRTLTGRHNHDRPVWIWGAGAAGEKMLDFLNANNIEAHGFLDSNASLSGSTVRSLPITQPDDVLDDHDSATRPYILIASMYAKEIAETLESKGFIFKQDYVG